MRPKRDVFLPSLIHPSDMLLPLSIHPSGVFLPSSIYPSGVFLTSPIHSCDVFPPSPILFHDLSAQNTILFMWQNKKIENDRFRDHIRFACSLVAEQAVAGAAPNTVVVELSL